MHVRASSIPGSSNTETQWRSLKPGGKQNALSNVPDFSHGSHPAEGEAEEDEERQLQVRV